ncbi:ATP-dependent DNA helicase [Iamia sp. SCSIO 61187]|uniref:ATP-dependent DNA helicase n=1 Tax=Iamia sp. SCSIO 61187 TaxID=2722752 RepID=UPI001C62BBB8|nr:ATP-dependent DNA helicase [Iamia sp. SCSIO 61187]QYG93673.1 ATP-dependent DNA helicase [Iamia sp. SCSIO 61187]
MSLRPADAATAVTTSLARVTAALPGGGEERPGQVAMAEAVTRAIAAGRHVVVQAGTGTGKSLAYLVPAALSGQPVVIATATKALQDQLVGKDLPFLADHLDEPLTYAVLKGRSNYVCRQRLGEIGGSAQQLALDGLVERAPEEELREITTWAATTVTGDRAELPFEPSPEAWAAVSVGSRECPGATRCPQGGSCFAESARTVAADADVIVVNLHLYGLHLESGGVVLPEHDVVIIDEAHQLEDVISSTFGVDLTAGRFAALARLAGAVLEDPTTLGSVEAAGAQVADALAEHVGRRLRGRLEPEIADAVADARIAVDGLLTSLKNVPTDKGEDTAAKATRASKAAGRLADELDAVLEVRTGHVMWVEGPERSPSLRLAPVDVAPTLAERLWAETTAVLTSATVPPAIVTRLGLPEDRVDVLDVGSPFDHEDHALLYCAVHLPDPREPAYEPATHAELMALIEAAGGRTLALFTSYRAMDAAAEVLKPRLSVPVLTQRDLPKPALVAAFTADEPTCLFATMGFWQGVDVPGRTLSLVAIDRIPFPRPDEPLMQARREAARADAFRLVDLDRAATLLAQGAGRLIRSSEDRGVVAVLDPRLAKARYRWDLVRALPPMRRTKDRAEAEAFLRQVTAP